MPSVRLKFDEYWGWGIGHEALNSINESLNSINESLNSINEALNSVNEALNSVIAVPIQMRYNVISQGVGARHAVPLRVYSNAQCPNIILSPLYQTSCLRLENFVSWINRS